MWRPLLPLGIAVTLGRGGACPCGSGQFHPPCAAGCEYGVYVFLAAGVTGAWVLPGPAAPVSSAAPFACSSANVPAPGVVSPAGATSAAGSAGRHERAWESPCSVRHSRRSSGGERSFLGKKHGKGQSPSPARSSHSVRASASTSSAPSDGGHEASAMPPPPAGCPGVGGSCSKGDRLASTRDRSPQPGPLGLDGLWIMFFGPARSFSA